MQDSIMERFKSILLNVVAMRIAATGSSHLALIWRYTTGTGMEVQWPSG